MLAATILESSTSAVLARMAEVSSTADLLELRADAVPPGELDLRAVLARRARPVLLTCRPEREGGLFRGDEDARLALLREAVALGVENLDVEWDAAAELGPILESTRLLVSRHDFSGELAREELFSSVRSVSNAHVLKVAQLVADARDGLDLLARASRESKPTIAIGMGFPGIATRLLAERAGAPWTYAAADPGAVAAPGQLPLLELASLLRGRRITRATKALGVLGRPVSHSRSPRLVNAVLATLGIDAVYAWLETDLPEEILARAKADAGWLGFSVTIPHKERVARACDRLSREARATGAVNTVVRSSDGSWVGHNTDAPAIASALERAARLGELELRGLPVEVLGAGGAARAAVYALHESGARVTLYDRTDEKGKTVAAELGVAFGGPLENARATGRPRGLVNATSVGMSPNDGVSPVGLEAFDERTIALDLVYTPEATRFLAHAEARGAARVSGLEVFVLQARGQLELWLGKHIAQRVSDDWLASRARGSGGTTRDRTL
jgi:3-dehydroquinate dehydratase/shikimate dehydrogenase